ncbi:MAG: DUF362 domain-containing protein [Candidatus Eisenbacteria bacterium]
MSVFLSEVRKYDVAAIEAAIERGLEALGLDLEGKRTALLKPNIVMGADPKTAIVTNPVVVEALVSVLRKRGLEEISIADGPGVGLNVDEVFEVTGYRALAERLGVRLINFNTAERRERPWKYGTLGVPAVLEDADLYVNVPKLKTHGYTTVTLSIKNHKGMLCEEDKKLDHHLGLHRPLAEQAKLRPPDLVVLDGVVGIEGDGPLNGRPVRAGIFAMGTNMLEVDSAAARLVGFDPRKVKHLAIAGEEGLGSLDPELIGEAPSRRFDPANEEYGRVMNIYSWRDCTACSMCIDSFSAGVKLATREPRYWFTLVPKLAFWGVFGKLHIIQGREAKLPNVPGRVICLGRCTAELAKREGLVHLPGCPPSARDVAESLRKKL